MAPGPKKRNFHTPRNTKNTQISKSVDKKTIEPQNEIDKNIVISNQSENHQSTESGDSQRDKYSKRSLESNWIKYEEPQVDPHADSLRGRDFNVLLSYSGGAGSQLKLQDEKEWEDESMKDLSLDIPDLVSAMKCIPFHERIGLQNIFDKALVMNFVSSAKKHMMSYKSQSKPEVSEYKDIEETPAGSVLNIIEESCFLESDDGNVPVKNFVVQDKTEDIINALASNLSFKTFSEKEDNSEEICEPQLLEEKKSEAASNDLDFLLSLNISSKITPKEDSSTAPKNTNVDDWLNSILDD